MEDILEPTIVDHTVRPILCGPIGSARDVSHGKPRNVDYLCALLVDFLCAFGDVSHGKPRNDYLCRLLVDYLCALLQRQRDYGES